MADDIELVEIKNLQLDPDNPRLPTSVVREDKEMLDYIARETSIEELTLFVQLNVLA